MFEITGIVCSENRVYDSDGRRPVRPKGGRIEVLFALNTVSNVLCKMLLLSKMKMNYSEMVNWCS